VGSGEDDFAGAGDVDDAGGDVDIVADDVAAARGRGPQCMPMRAEREHRIGQGVELEPLLEKESSLDGGAGVIEPGRGHRRAP
jgi:hypothetical protein